MNNEEKILELLSQVIAKQDQHTAILDQHTAILDRHTAVLDQHTALLEKHTAILERHDSILERHDGILGGLQADMKDVKERLVRVELTQENVVLPQLRTLAEGHALLLEKLAPKDRVDALEDEIVFMKSVIKALSQEVAELKKAQ